MNSLKKIFGYEYVWLSILAILFFIIQKSNSTRFFYAIIAIAISLYLFPIQVIIDYSKQKKLIVIEVLSNFFVGAIVGFSILAIYLLPNELSNFIVLTACFGFINLLFLILFYFKNNKKYKNIHLVLIFLISMMLFGL